MSDITPTRLNALELIAELQDRIVTARAEGDSALADALGVAVNDIQHILNLQQKLKNRR
jgi:hypothetical protein